MSAWWRRLFRCRSAPPWPADPYAYSLFDVAELAEGLARHRMEGAPRPSTAGVPEVVLAVAELASLPRDERSRAGCQFKIGVAWGRHNQERGVFVLKLPTALLVVALPPDA
jgi:hypothetical protein